ncbi:hypothetical protein A9HBioS_3458 [Pseudomonas koreensis]|uniref:Uncharacterized protein n=1 Tax=Pseudomonas koreensis TaxID=198620 RepID=A0AA94EMN1_9PSED|nr:hypothetical protein A9HBioS_3458 [Pseudomonas koreensis]
MTMCLERVRLIASSSSSSIHAATVIPASQKLAARFRQTEVTRALITLVVSSTEKSCQIGISRNALHAAIQLQITRRNDPGRECQNSAHRNGGFEPFDFLRQRGYVDSSLIDRSVPGFDAPHDCDVARTCFRRGTRYLGGIKRNGVISVFLANGIRRSVQVTFFKRTTCRRDVKIAVKDTGYILQSINLVTADSAVTVDASPMIPAAQELPAPLRQAEVPNTLITLVELAAQISAQVRVSRTTLDAVIQLQKARRRCINRKRDNRPHRQR